MCCRSLAGMFRNPHGGSRVSNCQRIVVISLQCLHKTTRVSVREAEAKHDAWVRRRKKKAKKKKRHTNEARNGDAESGLLYGTL